MKRIVAMLCMLVLPCAALAVVDDGQEARAAAVVACAKEAGANMTQCVQGVALLAAIEGLREAAVRGGTGGTGQPVQQVQPQQVVGRTAWDVFASLVLGTVQFVKETVQTVGPIAGQVYQARTNADVQKVVAKYNADTQQATVAGFTTMGGHIAAAGTAGYQYVQAPGAVTTNTLSGTGVLGSGTYTAPVTTTTTTDSHANPTPTVVTCTGTPTTCAR